MGKFSLSKKDSKNIISEEVATCQVLQILEHYDIDVDVMSADDEKTKAGLSAVLEKLVSYIREGKLSVENEGKFQISQKAGNETITYREVNAVAKLAMDNHKQEKTYHRIYALMGSLSGLGDTAIKKLSANDLAVVETLGTVLMNA